MADDHTDEPTRLADDPSPPQRKGTALAMGAIFVFFATCFVVALFIEWMPSDPDIAGGFGYTVDPLYDFIYWTSVFFFIVVGACMFGFAVVGRQQKHQRNEVRHGATHNTLLELGWTVPPLVLVLAFFLWGFRGYLDMVTIPGGEGGAYLVDVEAYQWGWQFTYPNGGVSSGGANSVYLDIPAGRPVRFRLSSRDVLHSLYFPDQRVKKDCVPGRYNEMWVEVPVSDQLQPGMQMEFPLRCTEYCGAQHSQMNGILRVWHPEDWAAQEEAINTWNKPLADGSRKSPVELGKYIHEQSGGCVSCHNIDGEEGGTGPTWKNLYKQDREGPVDEAYILASIYYPGEYVLNPYPNQMASYAGQLNYGDVLAVDAYIRSLTEDFKGEIRQEWPAEYDGRTWLDAEGNATEPPLK